MTVPVKAINRLSVGEGSGGCATETDLTTQGWWCTGRLGYARKSFFAFSKRKCLVTSSYYPIGTLIAEAERKCSIQRVIRSRSKILYAKFLRWRNVMRKVD